MKPSSGGAAFPGGSESGQGESRQARAQVPEGGAQQEEQG